VNKIIKSIDKVKSRKILRTKHLFQTLDFDEPAQLPLHLEPPYPPDLARSACKCPAKRHGGSRCLSPIVRNLTDPTPTFKRTRVIVRYCHECRHVWHETVGLMREVV